MRTNVDWVIDYYSPIPIIKTGSSGIQVLSEDLFFVTAHDNQYDLLYGDYQNTLPIKYLLCVRSDSELVNDSPNINLINFNLNYTNADVKCIYGVCDTASGHGNFLSVLDIKPKDSLYYNNIQNNIKLVTVNNNVSFGSWKTNKAYQILDFTDLNTTQKVYNKSTGSLYSGFNATGRLVYGGPDDSGTQVDNTRPVIKPTSTNVVSNISFNIEIDSEVYKPVVNKFSAIIEFDLPVPVLSGIPYEPGSENYGQGSEKGFQLFSNTASNIWKYQFADTAGTLSNWKTVTSKNPNIRYSTSTDVSYVTKVNYDCYAVNTGFKGVTKSIAKGTGAYERSLYFTQFALVMGDNNSTCLNVSLGSNISNLISNMWVQLKRQSQDGSWTTLTTNEARFNTFGSWNVQFNNINTSNNYKYNVYAQYSNIISEDFDLRSIYFSQKINYLNQITNEPYGQFSKGTTIALGLVDKKCYVSGTSDIATTFDWQLQLNSLSYSSPNTLYPYQHLWINTKNTYHAKAQRTNSNALWNRVVHYSNAFTVDTIQPSIHLSNLHISGPVISFTATAKYGHDNGEEIEYSCKNWQYALVEKNDGLKGIRQTIFYHGVDAKTAKDNKLNGAVGNYDRLTGPYYITYTNEDITWVDIPNSTGNSSIDYTISGIPNKDYILLVRATRELNNLPCNMCPQFDMSTINNNLVAPAYIVHTEGGVPVYYNDKWQLGIPYIYHNNKWTPVIAKVYLNGNWIDIDWDGTTIPWDNPTQEDNNLIITQSYSATKENNNLRIE